MKHVIRLTLAVIVVSFSMGLFAQDLNSQIATVRAQTEADRQAVVAETMNLSEEESAAFWPLYKEYRAEMEKTGDRAWKLLIEFADKYDSMNDADATRLLDEAISIEKKRADIKSRWMKKMQKSLSPVTVARFYQIDGKIDALLRLDAVANVPLAMKGE